MATEQEIDRAVVRIWDRVLDELWDITVNYNVEADDPDLRRSIIAWLGDETYYAFIESAEED